MRIHIPNSVFLGNINHFLSGFDPSEPDKLEITAHEKWFWVHPVVLCMIAAIGKPVQPKNVRCEILARTKHYLTRMGLFDFLGIPPDMEIEKHEEAGRFVPLTQITTSDQLSKFLQELQPLLHLQPDDVEPIRYSISELVRNVLEHAESGAGAIVCAQYFPNKKMIRIGIVDTGIGIRRSISDSHIAGDDLEAIRLALTPGITGTTRRLTGSEQNAGAGLFFIKTIAYVNRDPFVIYSGSAMYKLLKRSSAHISLKADPFRDKHSKEDSLPYWQGVVAGIDIALEKTKEFKELLHIIRNFYSQTVKEKKSQRRRLKKPKFV